MGYKKQDKAPKASDNGFKATKVYTPESTDLALTPPEKDWTVDALTARLNKHADAIESATADARQSSISNDATGDLGDLSKFGFNEKTSR